VLCSIGRAILPALPVEAKLIDGQAYTRSLRRVQPIGVDDNIVRGAPLLSPLPTPPSLRASSVSHAAAVNASAAAAAATATAATAAVAATAVAALAVAACADSKEAAALPRLPQSGAGVALVTGGLRGVGFCVARYLLDSRRCSRVVMVGRSHPRPRDRAAVDELVSSRRGKSRSRILLVELIVVVMVVVEVVVVAVG